MEVTLDLTVTLIIVFIIHTIFTHLLNWFSRECGKQEIEGLAFLVNIIEIILVIVSIVILTT